jgi:PAS domain S-box-containing protein
VYGPTRAFWWNDAEHAVQGMLSVISSSLDGDLVLWGRVDARTGQVTNREMVGLSPDDEDSAKDRHPLPPDSLMVSVARSATALFIPHLDIVNALPEGVPPALHEYAAREPAFGCIAVPSNLDDGATGVLVSIRRTSSTPYAPDDLRFVADSARRLAGQQAGTEAFGDDLGTGGRSLQGRVEQRRRLGLPELVMGVGVPAAAALVLGQIDESAGLRPGVLLLGACIAAAIVGGVRAAVLAGVLSTAAVWWAFTPPEKSWRIATLVDALGVGVFFAAATVVVVLVRRLDRARDREHNERQMTDALLDQSHVAMAVVDLDLRFQRLNRAMAEMNGHPAADHIGRRPGQLSPLVGQLHEHLLARARDSGQPIDDREVAISLPALGLEHCVRISYRLMRDRYSALVGIGVTIVDITHEILARRQSARLLRLVESLSAAADDRQVAAATCSFLVDTFHGRSVMAIRDGDVLVFAAEAGSGDDDIAWTGGNIGIWERGPLTEAARTNRPVIVSSPAEFDERYPGPATPGSNVWAQASISMPLGAVDAGSPVGAMSTGWSTPHAITDEMTTLAETVSSLASLALARIAATRRANQGEFRHALDAMLDDVAIGRAVRSEGGEIVDFLIEFVNSHSLGGAPRDADTMLGRMVCEVYPHWRTSGMFDRIRDVVESGVPYRLDRMRYSEFVDDGDNYDGFWSLQVAKLGDGYIAAARNISQLIAAEEAALELALSAEAERTAIQLLQEAALPNALPERPGMRIAAVYEPADPRQPVGGDWYDVFAIDDDRVALVIADVAGHGRHAAAFMVQVRNVFRALAIEHASPGEVLIRSNNVTSRLNEIDGPFVTCCYAVLDVVSLTLRWAQAGHFSPLIVHADGTSTYLEERPGPPLALFGERHYESSSVVLNAGDRVLMFTDGLVERRREHLDIGLARLALLAHEHSTLQPQEFVEALAASVTERFDDLALLCVQLTADN